MSSDISEAERWKRRYERERAARLAAEGLAAGTLRRLNLQLEAARQHSTIQLGELKEHYLAITAHELRTPLTILQGGLHVLERNVEGLDRTQLQVLGTMGRATRRMTRIVENLGIREQLQDADRLWPEVVVDLSVFVRLLAQSLPDSVDVVVDVPDGLLVSASADLLGAAVGNLLHNAATYGRPPIKVEAVDGATVDIRVIDAGGGPPEGRLDLFEAMAQLDRGDRRTSRGLGLGLSVVLAAAHRAGWGVDHRRDGGRYVFQLQLPPSVSRPTPDEGRPKRPGQAQPGLDVRREAASGRARP